MNETLSYSVLGVPPCKFMLLVVKKLSPKTSDTNVGLIYKMPFSTYELDRLFAYH